ncbi:MAG: serine hydrolase domain-containing protein [Gemmatimonadaceae bacterium]
MRSPSSTAVCLLGALALSATGLAPQGAPPRRGSSTRLGFSTERLERIDRAIQERIDAGQVPGVVALVLRDGQVVYERAAGWSDKEAGKRMTSDAIFRIASQSKALTSVAILILVEEGKVALADPVGRFIPAYARTTVLPRSDTGSAVPARRQITIRDLLTHTAGISYGTDPHVAQRYQAQALGPAAGYGWYTADKDEDVCTTMERLATLPFVSQPGDAFVYGYNTDILGCVVERASGATLDEFVRSRISGPLGMKDTHFFLPLAKRDRLATVYGSTSSGGPVQRAPDGARGQGHYVDGPRRNFAGGAGLVSTARDYARFLQMLLNGGVLDGVRVLGPKTVELMTTNQVGTLFSANGQGFSLGFQTVERAGADGMASVGSYGWGGAYATTYKVDPKERLVLVFMLQMLPNASDIAGRFPTLVYQALVEPRQ